MRLGLPRPRRHVVLDQLGVHHGCGCPQPHCQWVTCGLGCSSACNTALFGRHSFHCPISCTRQLTCSVQRCLPAFITAAPPVTGPAAQRAMLVRVWCNMWSGAGAIFCTCSCVVMCTSFRSSASWQSQLESLRKPFGHLRLRSQHRPDPFPAHTVKPLSNQASHFHARLCVMTLQVGKKLRNSYKKKAFYTTHSNTCRRVAFLKRAHVHTSHLYHAHQQFKYVRMRGTLARACKKDNGACEITVFEFCVTLSKSQAVIAVLRTDGYAAGVFSKMLAHAICMHTIRRDMLLFAHAQRCAAQPWRMIDLILVVTHPSLLIMRVLDYHTA